MKPVTPLLSLLSLLAWIPAASAHAAPKVQVSDAWCRSTSPAAMSAVCYLTLKSAADDRLVSVETPAAAKAEVHDMDMTGWVMRMRKIDGGLPLPKGQAVALSPNGKHLMLMRPTAGLAKGSTVALTLRFSKAAPQSVAATVR